MNQYQYLAEGPVTKGGHNPPNYSTKRPPAPQGSCQKRAIGDYTSDQYLDVEQSWLLVGGKIGDIWVARRVLESVGEPHNVTIPWSDVLDYHQHGMFLGAIHTHPNMSSLPSSTDIQCMQSLVWSFGRELLCTIIGSDRVDTYLFDHDESAGIILDKTYLLDGGIMIAVDCVI